MAEETQRPQVQVLDVDGCWERIGAQQIGRLAFLLDGKLEVLPLNYAATDRRLLLTTTGGSPIDRAVGAAAALEIDRWDAHEAWSVVARGTLQRVTDPAVESRAQQVGLDPWRPHEQDRLQLLEVSTADVQGRQFERRQQPEHRWFW